jgi:hypothetical protein
LLSSHGAHAVDAVRPSEEEGESESEGEEAIVERTVGDKIVAEKGDELVKIVADPRLPTAKEIEKHCLTHLPYRNWCSVCVSGKGKDLDHRKCIREDRGLPEFSFDCSSRGTSLDTASPFWWGERGRRA